jgi:crotonobetainyl-CoA:carnitine CoA-transferase CaiB-like acyl-CoA transferase
MINRREIFWSKFYTAIGRADLEMDPRYNCDTLSFENSKVLFDMLQEGFLTKTLQEWKPILTEVGPWSIPSMEKLK